MANSAKNVQSEENGQKGQKDKFADLAKKVRTAKRDKIAEMASKFKRAQIAKMA